MTREEALAVAMSLVPGLYSRNKLFGLFHDPAVVRARSRARLIRSAFRQLSTLVTEDVVIVRGEPCVVSYEVPSLHLSRRVELSALELACLSLLLSRANVEGFSCSPEERTAIDEALATLPSGERVDLSSPS
jgi:hypothetical protein